MALPLFMWGASEALEEKTNSASPASGGNSQQRCRFGQVGAFNSRLIGQLLQNSVTNSTYLTCDVYVAKSWKTSPSAVPTITKSSSYIEIKVAFESSPSATLASLYQM